MFCKNCASKLPDNDARFCNNCGAPVQNGQIEGSQGHACRPDGDESLTVYHMDEQSTGRQSYNGMNNGQPNMGIARNKRKKTAIIAAITGVLILAAFVIIATTVLSPGPNSSPTNLVKAYNKCIYNEDISTLKKLASPEDAAKFTNTDFILKSGLSRGNKNLREVLGDDWLSKLSYKETKREVKDGKTYVTVETTINLEKYKNDPAEMVVVKEGSKYYLDESTISAIMG